MPLIKKLFNDQRKSILVWEISEPLSFFGEHFFDSNRNEKRQLEKSATRYILSEYFKINEFGYDNQGKPITFLNDRYISISHSKGWIIIADYNENVGIDIERVSSKAFRIKSKFIGEFDLNEIPHLTNDQFYTLVWAVKEAIFKKYSPIEHLVFSKQIAVKEVRVELGEVIVAIMFSDGSIQREKLSFELLNEYVIAYTL